MTEVDLSTTYMGLDLRSPLVASPGPLTCRPEPLRALQANGVAAVVLPSLFAEQLQSDAQRSGYLGDGATSGQDYLDHLSDARDSLDIPVIASLNGAQPGDWTRYARQIEDAGADALELNLYDVVTDDGVSAAEVECRHLELVADVRGATTIPLAVKVGPFYTAFAAMARQIVETGADALVPFNRFYQPDIDPTTLQTRMSLHLSRPSDMHLPLRWTALLAARLDTSIAVSGGVHRGADVASAVLAGADVAMMTSVLLDKGPLQLGVIESDLCSWVRESGCTSLPELRGRLRRRMDAAESERDHYVDTLVTYTAGLHDSWRRSTY